jgi:hypothetical protein
MNKKDGKTPGIRRQSDGTCTICSCLSAEERAYQKFGQEENATFLPAAASQLLMVRDLRSGGSRKLQLWQCPYCSTYYLYRTDYEYLTNGSEDEEFLSRLNPEQASKLLE